MAWPSVAVGASRRWVGDPFSGRGLHDVADDHPVKPRPRKELGGKCDQRLSAGTWDQMVQAMTKHVIEKHPDVAKEMEKMHNEDPKRWGKEMKPKWDAAPEA